MIKATSKEEAWRIADQLFPTDYMKDEQSSERAGYPIHLSTAEGHFYDYICDLGNRLEVNLSTGKTVNIWIEEPEEEVAPEQSRDILDAVQEMKAAKEAAKRAWELLERESFIRMTLCVEQLPYMTYSEDERILYRGLGHKEFAQSIASDFVSAYCDSHDIRWSTITNVSVTHYVHGNDEKKYGGHYIIEAFVSLR